MHQDTLGTKTLVSNENTDDLQNFDYSPSILPNESIIKGGIGSSSNLPIPLSNLSSESSSSSLSVVPSVSPTRNQSIISVKNDSIPPTYSTSPSVSPTVIQSIYPSMTLFDDPSSSQTEMLSELPSFVMSKNNNRMEVTNTITATTAI